MTGLTSRLGTPAPPGSWTGALALWPGHRRSRSAGWKRLQLSAKPIALSALAAALAWLIARHLAGHSSPFFAPVAAVIVVGLTAGQRASRAFELVVGQALGILCADLLIGQIGTGAAQIGLVVGLAMAAAVLVSPGVLLAQQAATSAVLVAVLQPPGSGLSGARFIDALIGGGVALLLNIVVFPTDPVGLIRRRGAPLLMELAATFDQIAAGLRSMDTALAERALVRARALDDLGGDLAEAIRAGGEAVALSPLRRSSRQAVTTQSVVSGQLDLAVRNTRVLARRALRAVARREPIPDELVRGLHLLADAVRNLNLAADQPGHVAEQRQLLGAAGLANACLSADLSLSVTVLVAQVRSLVGDLLLAAGLEEEVALGAIEVA